MEYPYIKNITHEKVQSLAGLVNAEDRSSARLWHRTKLSALLCLHLQKAKKSPPMIPPEMRW